MLAALFPILVVLLRRVGGQSAPVAVTAAAVGSLIPAVIGANVSAIAENLVLPIVALSVLAAWALVAPRAPNALRYSYGPLVGVCYAAHPRFSGAMLVAATLIVGAALARWIAPRLAVANLFGLATIGLITILANRWLVAERWRDVQRPEGGRQDWIDLVTTGAGWAELAKTATGQAWYLLVGSLGVALVAMAVVAHALWQRPNAPPREDAASTTGLLAERRARWLAATHLATCASVVFATSVAFFARNQFRTDHFVYGRHNDSFTPLWMAIGVAALVAVPASARRRWWLAATAMPIVVTTAVLIAARDPLAFGRRFSPFAAPAIARAAEWDLERVFVAPAAVALIAIAAITASVWSRDHLLERRSASGRPRDRRPPWSDPVVALALPVVAIVGGWSIWTGLAVASGTQVFAQLNVEDWNAPDDVRRLGIDHLAVDSSAMRARTVLNYPFALPEVKMSMYDGLRPSDPPRAPFVLTIADSAAEASAGSRIALLDESFIAAATGAPAGLAVWVRPGPQQDDLDRRGALLPTGFPTRLPDAAHAGDVSLLDPPAGPIRVEPGRSVRLPVSVHHDGSSAPWPDAASYNRPGRVRVVARITPLDPDGVPGAPSGGELTRWMQPGDRDELVAEVWALDGMLAPLPTGRYRVQLGIGQDGQDWFTSGGTGARFDLEVAAAP
jgi:hypothetical protein